MRPHVPEQLVISRPSRTSTATHRGRSQRWTPSHVLLVSLPAIAAAGAFASTDPRHGSPFYLFRFVVLFACIPICLRWLLQRTEETRRTPAIKAYMVLFGVWVLWAPATLIWSPVFEVGLNEILNVSLGLIAGLSIIAMARGVSFLRVGWTVAFLVTSAVALWELRTGSHLGPSLSNRFGYTSGAVSSTFRNPNDYAAFLLACLPFLVRGALEGSTALSRWSSAVLLPLWGMLIFATQSRTGLLGGTLFACACLGWAAFSKRQRLIGPLMVALFLTVGLAATPLWGHISASMQYDLNTSGRSDEIRKNLTRIGLELFVETGGRGVGAGAFESSMEAKRGIYDTGVIVNAHNSFVEVAAQYGLPLVLPLAAVLVVSAVPRTGSPYRRRLSDPLHVAQLLGLSAFVAGGLAGSSVLAAPWWWVLLGTVVAQAAASTSDPSPTGNGAGRCELRARAPFASKATAPPCHARR